MMRRSRGFPPLAAPTARVLILGSLPGQVSLRHRQYYAQPRNAFWRLMGALFGAGPELPYVERAARLVEQHVAVWDVCRVAVRPGSLDTSIELDSVETNDFDAFLRAHARIGLVCFNGAAAARLYTRLVLPRLPAPARSLHSEQLPSTSPAHASLRFEEKLERWRIVRAFLAG